MLLTLNFQQYKSSACQTFPAVSIDITVLFISDIITPPSWGRGQQVLGRLGFTSPCGATHEHLVRLMHSSPTTLCMHPHECINFWLDSMFQLVNHWSADELNIWVVPIQRSHDISISGGNMIIIVALYCWKKIFPYLLGDKHNEETKRYL